jgi:hypothetical protein
MTEIPIFPSGSPPVPITETDLQEGDYWGLFSRLAADLRGWRQNLPDPRRERLEATQNVWSLPIDPVPIPLSGGAGVLDVPQLFGPQVGVMWDIHGISATGFTAGTVSAWVNMPAITGPGVNAGALRAPFPQAGLSNWGKGQNPLRHGERLVFVAAGITGQAIIALNVTAVTEPYWSKYLL